MILLWYSYNASHSCDDNVTIVWEVIVIMMNGSDNNTWLWQRKYGVKDRNNNNNDDDMIMLNIIMFPESFCWVFLL